MSISLTEFVAKWRRVTLSERSASQQHFLDLCEVFDHAKPAAADPTGESFTFERGASKHGGGDGWADVWKKGYFGWEYKRRHRNLDIAYGQLLKYREALENPPLLVVCDMDRFVIHTNFTNTPTQVYEFTLEELQESRNFEILRAVFHDPRKLRPGATSETITSEAASCVAEIAQGLRSRGLGPIEVARFLDRIVFCLFAEDIELLPAELFTRMLERTRHDPERFARMVAQLFEAMAHGGDFGVDSIRHFNGHLFEGTKVLELTEDELEALHKAALLDWAAVDPSVFGTLFERGLDPDKRAQLGAHYTSREDIETLVDPVVMAPLRKEWDKTRQSIENLLSTGKKFPTGKEKMPLSKGRLNKAHLEAEILVRTILGRLADIKVLDPACGSGNFLYVTLQKLKDLEKEIIVHAMDNNLGGFFPMVGPWQLHGIEINSYAFELAQMTVWIGYLQWTRTNGFGIPQDPVLKPMGTFECRDAILDLSDPENPREPEWPKVDFIVGNPPFLGGKLLRRELGDQYVDHLFGLWDGRVPREADLCCYWFEKARSQIEQGQVARAGLLATQGIRGGANRRVLVSILDSGGIYFAESDREWILDGAMVHVSMVGFDDGAETHRILDGRPEPVIHPNLTAGVDVTRAVRLAENQGLSFMGDTKGGKFGIAELEALLLLEAPNPNGRPSSDVLVPWSNGRDVLQRNRFYWIIDFEIDANVEAVAGYEAPFQMAESRVREVRLASRSKVREWWLHERPRGDMRDALAPLSRFVATTTVSKHRIFMWFSRPTLPDHQLIVFARDDAPFFGVLHARVHEVWARAQGTQLRERESDFRYTPTSCFETFPFPDSNDAQSKEIAESARELDTLRTNWLNPTEWVKEEILEFPGSADGPWASYVHDPDERGIGTVRYPRLVPRDDACAAKLKPRTLTNLYNQRPTWLDLAHKKLDQSVFAAYGWSPDLTDDEILQRLLDLNLERAAGEGG
jgi:type II restriction/modification system DNA methylase subunit YeeA